MSPFDHLTAYFSLQRVLQHPSFLGYMIWCFLIRSCIDTNAVELVVSE